MTLDGLLIVNKPAGPTSHDVVARARRALGTSKIGHTGTLDPAASGVMALVVGQATRLAQFLGADEKAYIATVRFGVTTDTYDAAGTMVTRTDRSPDRDAIVAALDEFSGTFDQTPPAYSAKKIGGVRAYALARQQVAVAPRPVSVTVHELELTRYEPPIAELRVSCSAGFYVRSLAHDLGQRLGAGAILEGLTRTRSGRFSLDQAVAFEDLEPDRRDALTARLLPMTAAVSHLPTIHLTEAGVRRVRHGQDVRPQDIAPTQRLAVAALSSLPPGGPDPFVLSASSAALGEPSASSASSAALGEISAAAFLGPDGHLVAIGGRGKSPGLLHASVVLR